MNVGGAIDVTDLTYATGGSTSVTSTDLLTVSVGGHSYSPRTAMAQAPRHHHVRVKHITPKTDTK